MPHSAKPRRSLWAGALVAVWLTGTALGFWWFTMKDLRNFAPPVTLGTQQFDAVALADGLEQALRAQPAARPDTPRATVLHFWDPGCACSRFNEVHVQQLSASYAALGVRFLVVDRRAPAARTTQGLREALGGAVESYRADRERLDRLGVPASPAAAVFDRDGRLAYFGPYSEGAACLSGNGDFVEQVLDKLLAGERPRQINTAAFGCFCDWNHHT